MRQVLGIAGLCIWLALLSLVGRAQTLEAPLPTSAPEAQPLPAAVVADTVEIEAVDQPSSLAETLPATDTSPAEALAVEAPAAETFPDETPAAEAATDTSEPPALAADQAELLPAAEPGAEADDSEAIDIMLAADELTALADAAAANGNASLISVSLDAVPVMDVANMFSKISGANIIVAGGIPEAEVTANLKNVEWKTALNLVLGSVNLSVIEDPSGILMVVTSEMYREKLQQIENTKPLITRSFPVQYLNASDFIEQVKLLKILSPRGTIIGSQSREQERFSLKSSSLATEIIQNPSITTEIIVTDIKEYVDKVERLLRSLDKREPQVFIEARIVDVVSGDSKKLGFDWEMLDHFGASLQLQDLQWSFSDDHQLVNAAEQKDSRFDKRSNLDIVNQRYDVFGKQYEETTTTYEEQPPGSGNWVANIVLTPTRTITDSINRGRDVTSDKTDTRTDTTRETKMGTAILNVSDASLFLSALQRAQNTEMISHPLIVVGNKVEAKIHVGERYPTISSTKQSANPEHGQTESYTEQVEWNDLGLTLWVIPEIDLKMNAVRLTVNPSMSTWIKDITTPAGSVYPVISTRQVSTRANVPSKHTVVIGGLIDNQKGKREKRVPILSDIPLLGLLFKHTEDTLTRHNLLILLTPTILDERAPLTGLENIAQQAVDRLEKIPLAPGSLAAPIPQPEQGPQPVAGGPTSSASVVEPPAPAAAEEPSAAVAEPLVSGTAEEIQP